jgi:DNA (cytosine-5)-methyltransferase 1
MDPIFLIVDLFCGFGGTTTGFVNAFVNGNKIAKVVACVNHDPKAIKSHWLNHNDVTHYEEDIRTLDLSGLVALVEYWKCIYPDAYVVLWASLECTNFSKAKGGLPRNADSRTLAEHLFRYQQALNPDYIQIENVVEFMSWGPLDENGKPVSRKNGSDWLKWRNEICDYGYRDDWREMNSADYGAYTSRNRLFGCFAKEGLPIVWPEATHSKKATTGMFGGTEKWKAVKDVLNFEDEGESIFGRKKPLSDRTLERVYAGLIKYVANGDKSFLSNYKSGHPASKNTSIETVAGTLTTIPTQAVVQTEFLLKYNSINGKTGVHHPPSIDEPSPTVTCQARLGLIQPKFLQHYYSPGYNTSIDEPNPTVRTKDSAALINPVFLQHYYGNGFNTSIEQPCPTLTTKERAALVQPEYFIDRDFKSVTNSSIEEPAGTLTTVPKMNLVEAKRFLINPQFGNGGASIEKPCFTLIAKMDKRPPYLVQTEAGEVLIEVYDTDSEMAVKIKQFMAAYGLIDIKMRMLRVPELLKIQGFPEDYQMVGNQSDHKKFIGNSVVPNVVKAWAEAMAARLTKNLKIKVA